MIKAGNIPLANRYADLLKRHLACKRGGDFRPFDGIETSPRQFEIHLSNKGGKRCNVKCDHCQGRNLQQVVEPFDEEVFSLVEGLDGSIPLFVLSGAYTEPTLNGRLIELLELIKRTGSSFGLHTNATLLTKLEKKNRFITRLLAAANSPDDYMTIALNAGSWESFARTKHVDGGNFDRVMEALRTVYFLRKRGLRSALNVRVTYLLNEFNSSPRELEKAVHLMREVAVDSLRFAIPYAPYGTPIDECRRYKYEHELPFYARVWKNVSSVLSTDEKDKPLVFALPPDTQDIEGISFQHCFYGYFMINLGADGFLYRCSAVAHPGYKGHRLGRLTDDLEEFKKMILANQDIGFDPQKRCLPIGARCNRASININQIFEREFFPEK